MSGVDPPTRRSTNPPSHQPIKDWIAEPSTNQRLDCRAINQSKIGLPSHQPIKDWIANLLDY
jgi:hypothetical protein